MAEDAMSTTVYARVYPWQLRNAMTATGLARPSLARTIRAALLAYAETDQALLLYNRADEPGPDLEETG